MNFFDDFLEVVAETPMKVIFGTPTATPPAWLTQKYPEVLNCRIDGVKYHHGMRRHYNYNSEIYQKLSGVIVEKLAEHYAKHPSIIGWQIDNELNCEMDEFYSESDTRAFREFLKKKYDSLDALNKTWGNVFWNQEYSEWEEIYVPRVTVQGSVNPHQALDYIRFVSNSTLKFCKMQSDILKKYIKPGDFITTNGLFQNMDNHTMMDESLDVYTYDSYPNYAYCLYQNPKEPGNINDRREAERLTAVRSVCPHFGIMEQQSGAHGWSSGIESSAPKPGQMKLWVMQSIAHGADYISFFRWRTCTMGTEIYWHGILDYDNRDNRKLAELKDIYHRVQNIKETACAEYKAAFALVRDYSNVWDARVDTWHQRLTVKSEEEIFAASQISHTPMDYLYLLDNTEVDELLKYPLLIYPHGLILSDKKAGLLKEYVKHGGCLVIGAKTGQKDETGKCVMLPMPGLLSEISGATVSDYTFVSPADNDVYMDWNGQKLEAGIYNDILESVGNNSKVLAVYGSNYYEGKAALVENSYGRGKVLHFGGTFTRQNVKAILAYTGVLNPCKNIIEVPESCEIAMKEKDGKTYLFVLNYSSQEQEISIKKEMFDMDRHERVEGKVVLGKYETKVYKL